MARPPNVMGPRVAYLPPHPLNRIMAVLIIFPDILQTVINHMMLSVGGKESSESVAVKLRSANNHTNVCAARLLTYAGMQQNTPSRQQTQH